MFSAPIEPGGSGGEELYRQHLGRRHNGFFALSGAFVGFGRAREAGPLGLDWYLNQWPQRSVYSELTATDFVFGCDVFADLLFLRCGTVYRLDGETGSCVLLANDVAAFAALAVREAAGLLGGNLAREHFGGRYLDADPQRLLPATPFVIRERDESQFLAVPLTVALRRKAMLCQKIAGLADGDGVDLTFWREETH